MLVAKGEYTPRYYNPGNLFNEVHILMTNDDRPDPKAMQKTVGDAKLYLHNLPIPLRLFFYSVGLPPWLLRRWAESAVRLSREVRPSLIRCHGNHLNAYIASRIKQILRIPYVISLHTNPDEDILGKQIGWKGHILNWAIQGVKQTALNQADIVLPVYKSILPYTKRLGAKNVEVVYNVLNETFLREKTDYMLHHPIRIISVGRQFKDKNPENFLRATPMLRNVHLTLVGDGPYHAYLRGVVRECQMQDRVTFHRTLPNDELCSQLPDYDIFVVHSEYWEISKAVLEALLTGLPVVINRRVGNPVPELQGDFVMMVDNSVDGYYKALKKLIADDKYREKLGRLAHAHAQINWAPKIMEQRVVDLYKRLISNL